MPYPYLILDARYEKVREDGVIRSQAVMIAIGVDWEGRRNVLAVELANRESQSSWKEFCLQAEGAWSERSGTGDQRRPRGLRKAIGEVFAGSGLAALLRALPAQCAGLPAAQSGQRLPDGAALDLRPARRSKKRGRIWRPGCGSGRHGIPKLCDWVEGNIEETLTFYRLPRQHHKNLKSTNLLERLNEEIKRRTLVVRIFPNAAACLRLVRALAVEMHENWIEATRYLNMEFLREHKKELRRRAA